MQHCTNEYEYLVHLLRTVVRQEQPQELPAELSFETLYRVALLHDLAALSFAAIERLRRKPEEALYAKWRQRRDLALVRHLHQMDAREEILQRFQAQGIRVLEVQGSVIKRLYPCPELRTMSDLDLLIEPVCLQQAGQLMLELGYSCKDNQGVEIDCQREPNIYVELHTKYFSADSPYHSLMKPPFEALDEAGKLDVNELYLYNVLHIAKHYFVSGCGIRRVLDMYYLNKAFADVINRDYLKEMLQKAGVLSFARDLCDLAENWFGEGEAQPTDPDMVQYIFESRLHGTLQNTVDNRLKDRYSGFGLGAKLRYLWKKLFPGDRTMCKHYPFLKKWRILYPFCWIHRGLRMLFTDRRKRAFAEGKALLHAREDKKQ